MKEYEIKKAMRKLLQIQFNENNEKWINSVVPELNGYLVFAEGRFGLVDDEMEDVLLLPKFIIDGCSFSAYEKALADTYKKGFDDGTQEKQREVASVLGLVTAQKHESLRSQFFDSQQQ